MIFFLFGLGMLFANFSFLALANMGKMAIGVKILVTVDIENNISSFFSMISFFSFTFQPYFMTCVGFLLGGNSYYSNNVGGIQILKLLNYRFRLFTYGLFLQI